MKTPATPTISASDIAQLADVGRSTVSNWRNRYQDFPKPVAGESASPRFARTAVVRWLKDHDKTVKDLSLGRELWSAMNTLRGTIDPEEAGAAAADLITWRFVSDPHSPGFEEKIPTEAQWPQLSTLSLLTAEHVQSCMNLYENLHPEHAPLFNTIHMDAHQQTRAHAELLAVIISAVNELEPDQLEESFGLFQDQLTRSTRRGYDSFATSDALVSLVSTLAAGTPGPVHDPAVGSGRMLLATASRGENRSVLTGQDINLAACIHANQRAMLAGHTRTRIEHADVFEADPFGQGLAQVVVMDPPYGMRNQQTDHLYLDPRLSYGTPPKSSMDLAWLQLAIWYLGIGGRAFVLQPAGSAFRGGAESRIRAAMLQGETIEAIIALPAGLASNTQIPLNLWVLARPGEVSDPDRVLMIDHTDSKNINPETVATVLAGWRKSRTVPTVLPAVAVTITELLADKTNVNPRRWVDSSVDAPDLETVRSAVESLHQAANRAPQLSKLTTESIAAGTHAPRLVSITDLEKAGSLKILRTRKALREADYGITGTPIVTSGWIQERDETRKVDLSLFKTKPTMTQAGDILLQNTGGLAARVDTEGGRVLTSTNFYLLRPLSEDLRAQFLAESLVSAQNRNQAQGTAIQRVRLQDLKIPLLPLKEQDYILTSLAEVRALHDSAAAIQTRAIETRDALVDATTAGTISLG